MNKKPVFILPPNTIKMKVGDGGIPASVIKTCQTFLESNSVDFLPYAREYLKEIVAIQKKMAGKDGDKEKLLVLLVNQVMQIKSNGSMFQYQLLSMVSDVVLRFLEKVTDINEDLQHILEVYTKIVTIIINKKLQGNGNTEGYVLTQELNSACDRYNKKYNIV